METLELLRDDRHGSLLCGSDNIIEVCPPGPAEQSVRAIAQYLTDHRLHSSMLRRAGVAVGSQRIMYHIRASTVSTQPSGNSTEAKVSPYSADYYSQLAERLTGLKSETDDDGDRVVEAGAIETAIDLVQRLQNKGYSPPKVTWHGGDAVVMMWALGDTTYAITATDGQMGYVVRRQKQTLRIVDSISPLQFRLEDLR